MNTSVRLAAVPGAGQKFLGWTGDCSSVGTNTCVVSMTKGRTVSVRFGSSNSAQYALNVSLQGSGSVTSTPTGISCGSDCSETYAAGRSVSLTAAPASGQVFSGWSGACSGTATSCTVVMSATRSVQAMFSSKPVAGGGCTNFYAKGFELPQGKLTVPWATLPKPVRGAAQREAAFNTCEVRVTDHVADGLKGFARNDYSRRQAFNSDSSLQLVYAYDGAWHLYDAGYKHWGVLKGLGGDAEPQWDPSDPNVLYYIPRDGVGMKLYRMNVKTGVATVVGDFAARLKARWPKANSAWTRSEGSPSADTRYWCFMVDDVAFSPSGVGIFTWDRLTDTILGMKDVKVRPDSTSMSPSGNYCVVTATDTTVLDRQLQSERVVRKGAEHADLGIDANGEDVYISVDYLGTGMTFFTNLRTLARTDLFPTYLDGTATAYHFSGKAFNKPGWAVMSTHGEYASYGVYKQEWLHRKVMIVQLKANPVIYNLAHTHVNYNGYWTEPQASVNRDLTKIVWTSNWDVDTDMDVDTYMVEIPASSVK